jgi:hypothetical protein
VRHRASAKDGRPDECDGVGVGARTACGAVQPGETARAPKDGSALVCDSGGPSLCSHRGPNPNKTDADEKSDEKKKGRGGLGNVNRPNRGEDELKIVKSRSPPPKRSSNATYVPLIGIDASPTQLPMPACTTLSTLLLADPVNQLSPVVTTCSRKTSVYRRRRCRARSTCRPLLHDSGRTQLSSKES